MLQQQQQPAPNAATAKFQLALPFVLSSISPNLAALHATRARLLYPADNSLAGTHCTRCGTPFLTAGGRIRSIRRKKKKSYPGSHATVRVLRRSCRTCGFDEDVPLETPNPPTFPKVRDRARRKVPITPHASSAAVAKPPVAADVQRAPVSQRHASRSLQSSTTPASSRSSSIAPSTTSRPSPAPPSATPASTSQMPISAQGSGQTKSRLRKKPGLQSLLARNREKQEQEKKRAEGEGQGLSAFLQGL
ncbi:hypothetical protein BD414DRAFT_511632 [Trametes punicea]|nr:hypothetical protein BD414DRAFT_511632 [Trametes punicea]